MPGQGGKHLDQRDPRHSLSGSLGLEVSHERESLIVHRDIKPSNILVYSRTSNGIHVKLSDFGYSRERRLLENILWYSTVHRSGSFQTQALRRRRRHLVPRRRGLPVRSRAAQPRLEKGV